MDIIPKDYNFNINFSAVIFVLNNFATLNKTELNDCGNLYPSLTESSLFFPMSGFFQGLKSRLDFYFSSNADKVTFYKEHFTSKQHNPSGKFKNRSEKPI